MEITVESEINEDSSESDKLDGNWSGIDAGISNMNTNLDKTFNLGEIPGDIHNLSDVSVSSANTFTPRSMNNSKYLMPVEITDWEPCLIEDKLVISGSVPGLMQTDRICKQRLSSLIFKDDDGLTCCILGPMKTQNDVPDFIRNQFKYIYRIEKNGGRIYKDGIPDNWLKLCLIWKCYIDTVNKNMFDWTLQFKKYSLQPLIQENIMYNMEKYNGPKTKIKKKFDKYKSMVEQEILRNMTIVDSESDTTTSTCKKIKKKKNNVLPHANKKSTVAIQTNYLETDPAASPTIVEEQTSLNKRTSCYIHNQIPDKIAKNSVSCQTDLTLNDIVVNFDDLTINRIDNNQSSNVTIVNPIKPTEKPKNTPNSASENCTINDQLNKKSKNESNKKLIASNTILKDLTNNDAVCDNVESNDDTSSLEFYENIVANSTAIGAKTPRKPAICKSIHYICSKTLERFEKRTSINVDANTVDNLDVIDIDLFSQTILKSPASKDDSSMTTTTPVTLTGTTPTTTTPITLTATTPTINLSTPDKSPDPKQLKTIKNNLEKTNVVTTQPIESAYKLRSPKRYIVTKQSQGLKRKKSNDMNDGNRPKKIALNMESIKNLQHPKMSENTKTLDSSKPLRVSLRNRKKLNYRELLFNRIRVPENAIIPANPRKSKSPLNTVKKTLKQTQDEKLFRKCFVILKRENLELKTQRINSKHVISTSKFTVTDISVEKENSTPEPPVNTTINTNNPVEHVFKTPLTTVVKKKKTMDSRELPKLNKSLLVPNHMPKITKDQRKLSLPANALEMWRIIKSKSKFEKPEPLSPFSIMSDASSDASDKKRRKLFSPDNWMQSDGCLKNLSQNQYQSNDSRFSIRFDDTDPNMDSELSDSSFFTSS